MTIKSRKLEYQGHIMRNNQIYGLPQLTLYGKINYKTSVGKRITWLKNFRNWFVASLNELLVLDDRTFSIISLYYE